MAELTGNGLATAVALAGGAGEAPAAADGQGALFDGFEADAALPLPQKGRSGPQGGRPAGARNRSTEEWRRYMASRYRSPLVVLAEMWSRSTQELARDLQLYKWHEGKPVLDALGNHVVDTGAAAALQKEAAIASLPYWHQKLPQAIELPPNERGLVVINIGGEGQDGASDGLTLPLAPIVENQALSGARDGKSDGASSDVE